MVNTNGITPNIKTINVEVVYGLPERQHIQTLQVPQGTTAIEAVHQATRLQQLFPAMQVSDKNIGIFSRHVKPTEPLQDNDRVEIYRPLIIDPKESRRQRVARKK